MKGIFPSFFIGLMIIAGFIFFVATFAYRPPAGQALIDTVLSYAMLGLCSLYFFSCVVATLSVEKHIHKVK